MNAKNAAKQPKPKTRIFFHKDTPKIIVEAAAAEAFKKIAFKVKRVPTDTKPVPDEPILDYCI